MEHPLNRQVNIFSVEIQKKNNNFSSGIESVITTKLKANSVGAENLKSQFEYNGEDAEVWIFIAGDASISD